MKLLRLLPIFICLFTTSLLCRPSTAQEVSNLYMAGGSYSAGASPAFAGTALYAHQVTTSGTYAFSLVDALPSSTRPFSVTTSAGVGVAQKVLTIANIPIFVPTAAGISFSGSNTGWAWSTGAGAIVKLKDLKSGGSLYLMPTARVEKSSADLAGYRPIIGVLFGFGK